MEQPKKIIYVLGFMFSQEMARVAMIKKKHPDWMMNLLNGVGGVVQEGETPLAAMIREFKEEADLEHDEWEQYATVIAPTWEMHCFSARTNKVYMTKTVTKEEILKVPIERLRDSGLVPNTTWLIEMAMEPHIKFATINLEMR